MRLFVALDLPDTILKTLEAVVRQLSTAVGAQPSIRWSPVENLHITNKFIGEWPESRLGELKTALAAIGRRGSISISVEGLGWFPNSHSPRVFWAGVHAPEALQGLARATDQATAELGIPLETKPFHPHLTLARIKPPASGLNALRQSVARLGSVGPTPFEACSQFLYSSQPTPSGAVYKKLEEFPFS